MEKRKLVSHREKERRKEKKNSFYSPFLCVKQIQINKNPKVLKPSGFRN
jgi:hypothetical protein